MKEELKVTGLVLGGQSYKEKDSLLNIFTVDIGKITASIRGVKLPKAKMKIFAQPFCLAEFIISKNGPYHTIISANLIDDFMEITKDMDDYCIGNMFLELCNFLMKPGIISQQLFITTIKALRGIIYDKTDSKLMGIKYLLSVMRIMGTEMQFDKCSSCGSKYIGDIFLDLSTGSLCCRACATADSVQLTKAEFNSLRLIDICDFEKLKTVKIKKSILDACFLLLKNNFQVQTTYKIKSILDCD